MKNTPSSLVFWGLFWENVRRDINSALNYEFSNYLFIHDGVNKWKHFPTYWPFVWGIHWSPVNSPHKGQWRGALVFPLICTWMNGWESNRDAGDLRRQRAHYDVTVISYICQCHFIGTGTIVVKWPYRILVNSTETKPLKNKTKQNKKRQKNKQRNSVIIK